jgi:hypothetical protein
LIEIEDQKVQRKKVLWMLLGLALKNEVKIRRQKIESLQILQRLHSLFFGYPSNLQAAKKESLFQKKRWIRKRRPFTT